MEHDLTYEKRILDLLGYSIDEKCINNKWTIRDENGNKIGYTEYLVTPKENDDLGLKLFISGDIHDPNNGPYYHTVIDSDTISYNASRNVEGKAYHFDIKNVGDLHLSLVPVTPSGLDIFMMFELYSEKYGNIFLNLFKTKTAYAVISTCQSSLNFEYVYKINGYEVSEEVDFRNAEYSNINEYKTYTFKRSYRSLDNTAIYHWEGIEASNSIYNKDKLCVTPIVDGKFGKSNYIKNKTAEDYAKEHGRGIELFNQLRELTNKILPFKVDIFYEILKDDIKEYGLESFFEEDTKKLSK